MSKLNINNSEWLELVFEGKNKSYGAYQLRQEEGRTTMKAFFGGLLFLTAISSLLVFLSSFDNKPIIHKTPGEVLHVTDVVLPITKEKPIVTLVKKGTAKKVEATKDLTKNITIVDHTVTPETTPITTNANLGLVKDPNAQPSGDGSGKPNGSSTTGITSAIDTTIDINTVMGPNSVDKNPYFPGDFSKEIARKFVAPEMDEQKTLRVIVFFVVERDGSLSNIRVANDPGYGMGAEAIRVLKAIKTKWEPGMFKGQAVRTSFSLPILVKTGTQD
jgi:periplasmic protein TonB